MPTKSPVRSAALWIYILLVGLAGLSIFAYVAVKFLPRESPLHSVAIWVYHLLLGTLGLRILIFVVVEFLIIRFMPTHIRQKKSVILASALGILVYLAGEFLLFESMKRDRARDFAFNPGSDEQSQGIRREAEEFRLMNQKQQAGILAVGSVVLLVTTVWWVGQRKRRGPEPQATTDVPLPPVP